VLYNRRNMQEAQTVWYNATPHDIDVFELDEKGDVEGYLERGVPLRFTLKKTIPRTAQSVRLLSLHKFPPDETVVDGIRMTAYQPWTGDNLHIDSLPGKTRIGDHDPNNVKHVCLIVSLPTAEFMLQRAGRGGNLMHRATPTEVVCPNTGEGSKVQDAQGRIIGVLGMKTFGQFYYPAPGY
jgi:hypothetical protein